MADPRRHELIKRSVASLEGAVDAYFAEAHESLSRIREPIQRTIASVRELVETSRTEADYFLPFAEMFLATAEQQFQLAKDLIDRHGGPGQAKVVGDG